MYRTQSNQIKGLDKNEYEALREMCRYAKNLYNVGLYSIRQYFFAEGRYLRYESNYQVVKDNENYALLQAGVSQQILKVVDRSFRSFFNLLKKAKKGEYRYHDVRIPHYLEKDGYFPLILSTNAMVIKEGSLHVPMSHGFTQSHPDLERIKIPFPARLEGKHIKEVRIIPVERARFFTVQFIVDPEIQTIWEAFKCYTGHVMPKQKHYTPTFKAQVTLELLKEEKTVTQIAAEQGIHPGQLHRWKRQALDNFLHLFTESSDLQRQAREHEAQLAELYAQIGKLTTQLEWLKKKSGLDPVSH